MASSVSPTLQDLPDSRLPPAQWSLWRFALACAWSAASLACAWLFHNVLGPYAAAVLALGVAFSALTGGLSSGTAAAVLNGAAFGAWMWNHGARWQGPELALLAALFVIAAFAGYPSDHRFRAEAEALAMQNGMAALRRRISTERLDLDHFYHFSLSLLCCLDTRALFNRILEAVIKLQAAPCGMLLLFAPESRAKLEVAARLGLNGQQVADLQSLISPDFLPVQRREIVEDVNAPGETRLRRVHGISAMFSAPVTTSDGKALGVIVTFFAEPHRPHAREIRLTELYLSQAASAIENARSYSRSLEVAHHEQQRASLLRAVNDASLRIHAAVSLDSVLQIVTDEARQVVGAHQGFARFTPHGSWTRAITCFSASPDFASRNQNAGSRQLADAALFSWATSGATELLEKQESARDMVRLQSSALAAPLTTGDGHTMGAIRLADKIEGAFTEDDRSILVQLAHVTSVAIENVRLLRKAQEQIGERERAQEALERSKQSLQIAQRAAGIGVWEWDLQVGGLTWSDEIAALHAVSPGDFDGRYESWLQVIEPEDREGVHRALARAISTGAEFEWQYRLLPNHTGARWIEARGQVFASSGIPIRMSGIAMDITARKLSEAALHTSEKLAATGRLAATIAHEINNPLAAVTNLVYLLQANPSLDLSAQEYVKAAEAELGRVTHITRQTLGFYRDSTMAVEIDPVRLVEDVLDICRRKIEERGIAIRRQHEFEGSIRVFPGELRQVIANLICNAIEAAPAGGAIRVHTFRDERARATRDAGLRIVIADNGTGIPNEIRSRIFEPFFTTKGERGTGLGLWVTRGIVEKHGGSIRFRSSTRPASHGTCFSIFLPLDFVPRPAAAIGGSQGATAA